MTLVAPCSNDAQFEHVSKVMESVALRFPCRAILARIELGASTPKIEARASTVCSIGGPAQKRVCHEQIQVLANEGSAGAVVPTVLSLLVPDVPAYVWAPCERLLSTDLVRGLANYADAVILDSHRFSEPFVALTRARGIALDHPDNRARAESAHTSDAGPGFGILDLEWTRLQTWTAAIARAFDRPDARELLPELDRVKIELAVKDPKAVSKRERVTAAMLAGWIASHLGWTPASVKATRRGNAFEVPCKPEGSRSITLTPRSAADRPGSLLRVEVSSPKGTLRVRRETEAEWCTISLETGGIVKDAPPEPCGHEATARVCPIDDAEALFETLTIAPRDLPFERALPIALLFG
jgi:glucose-6-phosphate dehydrogenase assembly protein OpcA